MNELRDHLVGDALRRLDLPDHGPDFWGRLESRLGGGPAGAAGPSTDPPGTTEVDLHSSPAVRRAGARNRTPVLALAAAVAVVVALVVGFGILGSGGDDESQLDVADPTETTTPAVPGEELAAEAEETAVAWIDALGEGDLAAAYGLLDDQSRTDLDRVQFEGLSSALAEGAAAFGADGIQRDVAVLQGTEGTFHVVSFTGDVQREATVDTATYPVIVTATGVHFAVDGPQLELDPDHAPASGTTLASPLELVVGEVVDAWVWIDGAEPRPLTERGQVSIDLETAAGPGTHLVTLVVAEGDAITARSYTVVVP